MQQAVLSQEDRLKLESIGESIYRYIQVRRLFLGNLEIDGNINLSQVYAECITNDRESDAIWVAKEVATRIQALIETCAQIEQREPSHSSDAIMVGTILQYLQLLYDIRDEAADLYEKHAALAVRHNASPRD